MKKDIKIKFVNGLTFDTGIRDILGVVKGEYNFIESGFPDFIVYGPYGGDIPKGNFTTIGYYCECVMPDMSICDWAFGMLYEDEVKHDRYMHIQWHGFNPASIVKKDIDVGSIMASKTRFCNFIYSNPVPYREQFFKELSKYKPVDAPGKSMNNMPNIDADGTHGDIWSRKREFLKHYKFTIAFENYSHPGYHTEKLLDPMTVNSLPIYLGNRDIVRHFNSNSFINAHEYVLEQNNVLVNVLDRTGRLTPNELHLRRINSLGAKVQRRLKAKARSLKMSLQFRDFKQLIEKIIEIDSDERLYTRYLSEPWFHNNTPPSDKRIASRWREIFG